MDDLEQRCLAALRARHNRMEPCDDESLVRAIIPIVLEEAAKACENYMGDCLDDADVQRMWPAIRLRNSVYAAAIRAIGAP